MLIWLVKYKLLRKTAEQPKNNADFIIFGGKFVNLRTESLS